jgi:hypothetical protein
MSSEGGDVLRIPIEIKTDDLAEIQDLLNNLDKAESEIDVLKPRKGKGSGDETSRSAFTRQDPFDDRGGAMGGQSGEALPTQGRDKKSRSPFQRENEFSKMKDEVNNIQENQGDMLGQLVNAGFIGNIAGFKGKVKQFAATGAVPLANMAKGGMSGGVMGAAGLGGGAKGLLGKAGIIGMLAMVVMEVVKSAIDFAYRPGGPLDRRFKRDMDKESVRMIDLGEKSDINQGRRIVRVTSSSSLRGTDSQVRSSLDVYKSGQRVFDMDGTLMVKNPGVGDV